MVKCDLCGKEWVEYEEMEQALRVKHQGKNFGVLFCVTEECDDPECEKKHAFNVCQECAAGIAGLALSEQERKRMKVARRSEYEQQQSAHYYPKLPAAKRRAR